MANIQNRAAAMTTRDDRILRANTKTNSFVAQCMKGRSLRDGNHDAFIRKSIKAFLITSRMRSPAISSSAHARWWGCSRDSTWPDGFSHTQVWWCPVFRLYAVTTEPYDDRLKDAEQTCKRLGWQYHTFPAGYGMWFPMGGTRLVLVSPGKVGIPTIEQLSEKLLRVMPMWTETPVLPPHNQGHRDRSDRRNGGESAPEKAPRN
jgi:hypothetical protein